MNPTVTESYRKLGVDRAKVSALPRITPQLRKIGKLLENLNLNLPRDPYYYLAASDHPDARAILDARASISRYMANLLPIEAFCLAASIPPPRVLEMVTVVAMRMGAQASSILAAMSHPAIVDKTIQQALTDGGVDDRAVLHKATGFLPTPKGSQVTIPINVSAQSTSTAQAASVLAPAPENTIRRLSERLNLRAGAAPQPALPVSSATELELEDEPVSPELVPLDEGEEVDDLT